MKENKYFRNVALTVVLFLALAACIVVRAFHPMGVLPKLDIPNMVLLSLIALLADHYMNPAVNKCNVFTCIFAILTFGLLPYVAGFAELRQVWKLALIGGAVFTITAWLFEQMQDRLSSGPAAKLAPIFSAFGLYLAAQCLSGLLL